MVDLIVYDKAKYHLEGSFPESLPKSQAYVHTGMFMAWLANNDLLSADITRNFGREIAVIKARSASPSSLYVATGGALVSDMLSEDGDWFTAAYFDFEKGAYLDDYIDTLCRDLYSLFEVRDNWDSYDKISGKIAERYAEWKQHAMGKRRKSL